MRERKNKLIFRFLSLFLAGLLVFNPLAVPLAWASEEEEGSIEAQDQEELAVVSEPETTAEPSSSEENQADDCLDCENSGDAAIETGDAESQAEIETGVNDNTTILPGEVSADDSCGLPEAELDCLDDILVDNDNSAEIANNADSSGITGENEIIGAEGDALIDTGGAAAGANLTNTVNTNLVVFGEPEERLDEKEDGDGQDKILVDNHNEVELGNEADVLAKTGENKTNENQGQAAIETGDALAMANLLNFLNANFTGSDFEILLANYLEGGQGNIDLNQLWKEIAEKEGEGLRIIEKDGQFFLVFTENQAELINEVNVTAVSGNNQANENQAGAVIGTGEAIALANVVNFVNLNVVGSEFFLVVINILGDYLGDLVLPRPERFLESGAGGGSGDQGAVILENQNSAEINDSVGTEADSGNNQTNGNGDQSLIKTGDAESAANLQIWANKNIVMSDWFFFLVNHLGSWVGKIFGWGSPEAQADASPGNSTSFEVWSDQDSQTGSDAPDNHPSLTMVGNQNQASVKNDIQVSAVSGQNQANENQGGAAITTGKAMALANLLDFINLNIFGSRWFLGVVNILGNWSGNIVFAYPDMAVSLTNGSGQVAVGSTTQYTLSYQNQGYDDANDVWLELSLPAGLTYLSDSSGLTSYISGQSCSWFAGDLAVGAGGEFGITVQVEPDFSPTDDQQASLLERVMAKIVSPVLAAETEGGREIVTIASIATADPESDLSNNTAAVKTIVYSIDEVDDEKNGDNQEENEAGTDPRLPKLEITAWNNVNDFVYPGDTVSFEITIRNTSDVPSHDTYLFQELFNGIPEQGFGAAGFEIGTIDPGRGVIVSFGLKLNGSNLLPEGYYHTLAQAWGYAPNGTKVESNQARTDFKINLKEIAPLFEARAIEEEEVLGAVSEASCPSNEDVLPYVLALLVSSLWLVDNSRKKLQALRGELKSAPKD
jgi:uncharacterized repeat protein (TIGR01451 family)